MFVDIIKAFVL